MSLTWKPCCGFAVNRSRPKLVPEYLKTLSTSLRPPAAGSSLTVWVSLNNTSPLA